MTNSSQLNPQTGSLARYIVDEALMLHRSGMQDHAIDELIALEFHNEALQLALGNSHADPRSNFGLTLAAANWMDSAYASIPAGDAQRGMRFKEIIDWLKKMICEVYNTFKKEMEDFDDLSLKEQLDRIVNQVLDWIKKRFDDLHWIVQLLIKVLLWIVRKKWLRNCDQ